MSVFLEENFDLPRPQDCLHFFCGAGILPAIFRSAVRIQNPPAGRRRHKNLGPQ
jgi:hypothetical protein